MGRDLKLGTYDNVVIALVGMTGKSKRMMIPTRMEKCIVKIYW